MAQALSVDDLLTMNDSAVAGVVTKRFEQIIAAMPKVRETFFANSPIPPACPSGLDMTWVERCVTALICAAIGRSTVCNFGATINRERVNRFLVEECDEGSIQLRAASDAITDAVFGEHCIGMAEGKKTNSFSGYLADNPGKWGKELADTVTTPHWRNKTLMSFSATEPKVFNKRLNLILAMVGRLAPSEQARVRADFEKYFGYRFSVMYENRITLKRPLDLMLFKEVSDALSARMTFVSQPTGMYPSMPVTQVMTAQAVAHFVKGVGDFGTGAHPKNLEIKTPGFCFIAGTPVHLADGRVQAIEAVAQDQAVLAADGGTTVSVTAETAHPVDHDSKVYGFNDVIPFFTAGHLFVTRDGLKAISPECAVAENPAAKVGRLGAGDVVTRIVSVSPFATEQVAVKAITSAPIGAGSSVYSLVLDGPQTYFAGGFAVAANYPQVTEAWIAEGIERLAPLDRENLLLLLGPVVPLLLQVLGGFSGSRLHRALGVDEPAETEETVPVLTEVYFLAGLGRLTVTEQRMLLAVLACAAPYLRKAVGDFMDNVVRRLHRTYGETGL